MDAILLAAGYATRLYPLTRHRAKPLLPVGGRPIIDHLVDRLAAAPEVDRLVLVTNAKFAPDFEEWAAGRAEHIEVLDDGSTCNDDRLGAVGDVQFALERSGAGGGGAYVLATDNLPRFDLTDIIALSREKGAPAVFACHVIDPDLLKRMGVAELAPDGRILSLEEKPERPRGRFRVPPFYVYTPEALAALPDFLAGGHSADAPGHFLAWLVGRMPVYAARRDEGTYDIGTLAGYRAVCEELGR